MQSPALPPPAALDGCRVLAYARTDEPVAFTGQLRLNVGGQWLGRVPWLAICKDESSQQVVVLHCSESWTVLGVQGWNAPGAPGARSVSEAMLRMERYYRGLQARWTTVDAGRA